MRLSQPFLARCLTRCGRIITFKHWHGSNFCKICQLQTVFSFHSIQFRNRSAIDLSILLLLIFIGADAPISTANDRGWSKADPFQRPDRGPEFDGIQFRTGFAASSRAAEAQRANLGRMQITFHNLLPVREFIGPIFHPPPPPPSSPIFPRSSPSQLYFKFKMLSSPVFFFFTSFLLFLFF